jgi:hypothetical protein
VQAASRASWAVRCSRRFAAGCGRWRDAPCWSRYVCSTGSTSTSGFPDRASPEGGAVAVAPAGVDPRIDRVAALVATPDWARPGMPTLGEDRVLLDQGDADRYAQWFFDALNPITHLRAYERDVAIAFLSGRPTFTCRQRRPHRFRTALRDRDPRAADRIRVDLYEDRGHLDAARDERFYSAALKWLAPDAEACGKSDRDANAVLPRRGHRVRPRLERS